MSITKLCQMMNSGRDKVDRPVDNCYQLLKIKVDMRINIAHLLMFAWMFEHSRSGLLTSSVYPIVRNRRLFFRLARSFLVFLGLDTVLRTPIAGLFVGSGFPVKNDKLINTALFHQARKKYGSSQSPPKMPWKITILKSFWDIKNVLFCIVAFSIFLIKLEDWLSVA